MKRYTFVTGLGEKKRKASPEEISNIIDRTSRKRLIDDDDCIAIYDDKDNLLWAW